MEDVDAVHQFMVPEPDADGERLARYGVEEFVPKRGAQLLRVVHAGKDQSVRQDDGRRDHRPRQRTAARLIDPCDEAVSMPGGLHLEGVQVKRRVVGKEIGGFGSQLVGPSILEFKNNTQSAVPDMSDSGRDALHASQFYGIKGI
jgi:hypothetical protein